MSNVSHYEKIIAFSLALLSGSVLASSNTNWVVSFRDYEGYPLFTRHPTDLNFDKLQKLYPIRIIVDLTLAKVKDNGLPENDYNKAIEELDNFVVEYFENQSEGQCVLVETYAGKRHFYSYVSNSANIEAFKREINKKFPKHEIEFDIKPDKNWSLIRKYTKEILSNG
jgi:hypothetical protein